jgi:hypothetical protein
MAAQAEVSTLSALSADRARSAWHVRSNSEQLDRRADRSTGRLLPSMDVNCCQKVGVEKVSVFFGAPRLKPHYNETSVGLPALKQWQVSRLLLAHSRIEPVV